MTPFCKNNTNVCKFGIECKKSGKVEGCFRCGFGFNFSKKWFLKGKNGINFQEKKDVDAKGEKSSKLWSMKPISRLIEVDNDLEDFCWNTTYIVD
jgi:hypothetical protein